MDYYFRKVKRENLTEEILKNVLNLIENYKKSFLINRGYFNCLFSVETTIILFFNENEAFQETIKLKSLSIEDFLYGDLEGIMFDIQVYLNHSLEEMYKKELRLKLLESVIFYSTNGNITTKI